MLDLESGAPGPRRPPTLDRIDFAAAERESLEAQAANPDETTRGTWPSSDSGGQVLGC